MGYAVCLSREWADWFIFFTIPIPIAFLFPILFSPFNSQNQIQIQV
jgi:hypothetical protein